MSLFEFITQQIGIAGDMNQQNIVYEDVLTIVISFQYVSNQTINLFFQTNIVCVFQNLM